MRGLVAALLGACVLAGHTAQAAGAPALDERAPLLARPWPSDPQKFTFAILADRWSGGEGNWPIYDRAVDEINLLRPDFVITIGDMISGHTLDRRVWDAEWQEYFEHARRLEVPLLFIPGNHDISNPEMYAWWQEDRGRTCYSFTYRGCHFLLLDTEEERLDGRGERWEAQMRFALDDLAANAAARHTFIFMHKPMWREASYAPDWARIEAALGRRPATIFGGHWHVLDYERRSGRKYVVLAATGGGVGGNRDRRFGGFQQYTQVTVEGDSARVAIIEPGGSMWPEDVAPRSFREGASKLVALEGRLVGPSPADSATVSLAARLTNTLPDTVAVGISLGGVRRAGWRLLGGPDSVAATVPPGEQRRIDLPSVRGPAEGLHAPPYVPYTMRSSAGWTLRGARGVPFLPDSAVKVVPKWMVVGPFDIAPLDVSLLPADPRRAMPRVFEGRGPEVGWSESAAFREGDRTLRWRIAKTDEARSLDFNALFGTRDHALGYALCGVYSPTARRTWALVSGDNFVQVLVNGRLLDDGQLYGRTNELRYVALPLKRGWNTLLVRLVNNSGDWALSVLIADMAGDLRFAPHPE